MSHGSATGIGAGRNSTGVYEGKILVTQVNSYTEFQGLQNAELIPPRGRYGLEHAQRSVLLGHLTALLGDASPHAVASHAHSLRKPRPSFVLSASAVLRPHSVHIRKT